MNDPLAMRRVGNDFYIRLAGNCTYPDHTHLWLSGADADGNAERRLWEVDLKAGSTEKEIKLGDPEVVLQVDMPFAGVRGQYIDVLVGSPALSLGWENEFMLPRVGEPLNGGATFDNEPIDVRTLNHDLTPNHEPTPDGTHPC